MITEAGAQLLEVLIDGLLSEAENRLTKANQELDKGNRRGAMQEATAAKVLASLGHAVRLVWQERGPR